MCRGGCRRLLTDSAVTPARLRPHLLVPTRPRPANSGGRRQVRSGGEARPHYPPTHPHPPRTDRHHHPRPPTRPGGDAVTPYRVLVTGSRDWDAPHTVEAALQRVRDWLPGARPMTVVHGACPTGADAHAARWAEGASAYTRHPVHPELHPAAWAVHGRAAGFRRNAEMVQAGAHVCLAFIGPCTAPTCPSRGEHGSHGATHCAQLAEQARITVRYWRIRAVRTVPTGGVL